MRWLLPSAKVESEERRVDACSRRMKDAQLQQQHRDSQRRRQQRPSVSTRASACAVVYPRRRRARYEVSQFRGAGGAGQSIVKGAPSIRRRPSPALPVLLSCVVDASLTHSIARPPHTSPSSPVPTHREPVALPLSLPSHPPPCSSSTGITRLPPKRTTQRLRDEGPVRTSTCSTPAPPPPATPRRQYDQEG
jgi:hypothetical protein